MPETDVLLSDYLQRWLAELHHDVRRGVLASWTWKTYSSVVQNHITPMLPDVRLGELTAQDVRDFMNRVTAGEGRQKPLAINTQKSVKHVLSAACATAVTRGLIPGNPVIAARVKFGKAPKGIPFTEEDQQVFFDAARGRCRYESVYMILVMTGLRIAEALGIQWATLDLGRGELKLNYQFNRITKQLASLKNKKGRMIDLSPRAIAVFQAIPRTGRYVWGSERLAYTRPVAYETVRVDFREVLLAAGLAGRREGSRGYGLHSFRHTYATRLAGFDTVPTQYIQQQLGHSSIDITADLYARDARTRRPMVLNQLDERGLPPEERH
jgi:integrase